MHDPGAVIDGGVEVAGVETHSLTRRPDLTGGPPKQPARARLPGPHDEPKVRRRWLRRAFRGGTRVATRDDVKLVLGGEYGSWYPVRRVSPGMSRWGLAVIVRTTRKR